MGNRFDSLYLIGRLLRIIGVAELVLAVASLVLIPLVFAGSDSLLEQLIPTVAVPGIGMVSGVLLGIIVFVIGLAAGLLTFSAGELFNLLLAIEENTSALLKIQKNNQK